MKNKQTDIVKFTLSPLATAGMIIKNMETAAHVSEHDYSRPHRDDHFLLMFTTSGDLVMDIDFKNFTIGEPALILVFPGQIHQMVFAKDLKGWGMNIDPALIDEEFQLVFERGVQHPLSLDKNSSFFSHLFTLLELMEKLQQSTSANRFQLRARHSLIDALIGLLAGEISHVHVEQGKMNRGAIIYQEFIQLLKENFREWKQPARYAAELNISVSHLYDTIKGITGDAVSAYIQQYCILEAKRLLCFTNLSVKEIAYQLGYEEPVYFGKLFKKLTGLTPIRFRTLYLD